MSYLEQFYVPSSRTLWEIESKLNYFKTLLPNNLIIASDFDKTFTIGSAFTSWSMLARSWLVWDDYAAERDALHAKYYPYEIDPSLSLEQKKPLIREWWLGHLSLLLKYQITKSQVDQVVLNPIFFQFRPWVKDFFESTKKLWIPVIIVSAWIWNFIEQMLEINWIDMSNVSIEANFLTYDENGIINWIDKEHVIHVCNKDDHILKDKSQQLIWSRTDLIVMWDGFHDTKIADLFDYDNLLRIWFLTDKTKNSDFDNTDFDVVNPKDDFMLINNLLSR